LSSSAFGGTLRAMTPRVGILVFEGAEELDFVGPWEVFGMATRARDGAAEDPAVELIGREPGPVCCAKGLRVVPDRTLAEAGEYDVLVLPGGRGVRRLLDDEELLAWIRERDRHTAWTTSVCTGSGLLVASGVAHGRRVTTHWSWVETLRTLGPCEVLEGVRYVRDGKLVTAAGVSAGIDMSLWVVGQLLGVDAARETQRQMEYDPAPPYQAEV
jgi:transcriptional regulator GlxA family with amidase domain